MSANLMIKRMFSSLNISCIKVTDNAWKKMNEITNKQNIFQFLFSSTSGGCNGFNYNLTLISDEEYDKIITEECQKIKPTILENSSTKILVDPISEFLLLGTTIDYEKEDYSKGIFESKFLFIPDKNLASTCGCGVSFTPKNF